MKDRVVQYPNRFKLVPVPGTTDVVDLVPVPGTVTDEGTPLSKGTLLSDPVGLKYGLDSAGTVSQALEKNVQILTGSVMAANWSSAAGADGYYTNRINVSGMKKEFNPLLDLVITSSALVDDEKGAFSAIVEADTFDGYVMLKVVDKPDINFNVRFMGV